MKSIKKRMLPAVVLMLVMVFAFGSVSVYAATVGDQLTAPEAGWKRIDDNEPQIKYIGNWAISSYSVYYNGKCHYVNGNNPDSVVIKFRGTKIRILSQSSNAQCNNVTVEIDGIMKEPICAYNSSITGADGCQTILFEEQNMSSGVHVVTLVKSSNGYFGIDAIDIDADGELIDYNQPINLQATSGDSQANLSWDAVTDATSYTVKRASIAGGPYTTITSNVTTTSYTDNTVTNGTTYYYVVTATVNGTESSNSNEASATPQNAQQPPQSPTNLTATAGDSEVTLSWDSVTDATDYTVKRAITTGGPYTTIASNVTATNYTDTNVTNGTTYYYVVTATVSGTESANSNEASATPQTTTPTPPQTGSAILVIKMVDGTEKEYDLSMTEINDFIDWYDDKDNGTGDAYYTIEKDWNRGPFDSRKDYIIFNKICFFEVNEY